MECRVRTSCEILSQIVCLRLFQKGLDYRSMPVSLYQAEYSALREFMRRARQKAGLTQVQIAERLGVGQSYVSKVERGENFVDVLLYVRWCAVCDVKAGSTLDRLFAGVR